ncbi:MAG: methyltransferase domain-containing protein, partial [Anaerolineales bacterium]
MEIIACKQCGATEGRLRFAATQTNHASAPALDAYRCTSFDYGAHDEIVACDECGLVFVNREWKQGALVGLYQDVEDPLYLDERRGRELTFRRHLRRMHRVTGAPAGRKLLDVGAYTGVFVEAARNVGWDAEGVEPSHWAVRIARRGG